jgi:hypothetical protein
MGKGLAVVFFLTTLPSLCQSRFEGSWQMKMDTLEFSGPPEKYLVQKGIYHCFSCIPEVEVKADGSDQEVNGHEAYYDTIAVRITDPATVSFTFKKDGKPTAESVETVSADGESMSEAFSNNMQAGKVVGKATFTRVSKGPPGSHALSGEWRMDTVRNLTTAGTITTFESTGDGFRISDGSQSCVAKFDGRDYPIGRSGRSTIALKLIDEYTLEETDKHDGKVMTVARMTVSKDGKSMTVESSDKQRGGRMIYTAEKRQ